MTEPKYEFKGRVANQTPKAVLLQPETAEKAFWIPKSMLSHEHRQNVEACERDDWVDVEIPQWLAESKGMV